MHSVDEPRDLIVYDQLGDAAIDAGLLGEINQEFPWIRVAILADNIDHAALIIAVEGGVHALLPKSTATVKQARYSVLRSNLRCSAYGRKIDIRDFAPFLHRRDAVRTTNWS